jgi:nicotinamidase-related amidase
MTDNYRTIWICFKLVVLSYRDITIVGELSNHCVADTFMDLFNIWVPNLVILY